MCCVNPKQFLPRLKALAPLVGRHYPSPILETVQIQATEDRRGVLHASCSRFPGEGYPFSARASAFASCSCRSSSRERSETGVPHPNRRIAPRP